MNIGRNIWEEMWTRWGGRVGSDQNLKVEL
jgi:hypothetical protein